MMGGGSASNDAVIQEQKAQAAAAEKKEEARVNRLDMGRSQIEALFGGGTFDPSAWSIHGGGAEFEGAPTLYKGIGDDFYDAFKGSILDYYLPQLDERFTDAKSSLLFNLGRRGLLKSSQAIDDQARLVTDKLDTEAQLRSDADNQTAALREDISHSKQNAFNLLQSTEDPTTAVNQALTEVNAIQSRGANLNPLGDIFATAATAYKDYVLARRSQQYADLLQSGSPSSGAGRVVT